MTARDLPNRYLEQFCEWQYQHAEKPADHGAARTDPSSTKEETIMEHTHHLRFDDFRTLPLPSSKVPPSMEPTITRSARSIISMARPPAAPRSSTSEAFWVSARSLFQFRSRILTSCAMKTATFMPLQAGPRTSSNRCPSTATERNHMMPSVLT